MLGPIGPEEIGVTQMPSRVKAHPFLTLMAVVSAILIVVGRVNHDQWWGSWSSSPESRCSWSQAPSSSS